MRVYKFLHSEHAQLVANGNFRFGNASEYRKYEEESGDDWIGDANEALAKNRLPFLQIQGGDSLDSKTQKVALLKKMGVGLGNPNQVGNVVIKNNTHISTFPCFILSFTMTNDWETKESMCGKKSTSKYNSCVSFSNRNKLSDLIYEYGKIEETGETVKDFCKLVFCDKVHYHSNSGDIVGNKLYRANPLIKHPKYSTQKETRIVISTQFEKTLPHITINCPQAKHLANIEF